MKLKFEYNVPHNYSNNLKYIPFNCGKKNIIAKKKDVKFD